MHLLNKMSEQSLTADVGGNFVLPPAGNHLAIVVGVYQLGTQDEEYEGHKKKQKKVMVAFELCNKKHVFDEKKGAEPFIVYKEFTFSMNKKAGLRKILEAWRLKPLTDDEAAKFNILLLVETACRINVLIKTSGTGKERTDVVSISQIEDDETNPVVIPDQHNPSLIFTFSNPFNTEAFNKLPEWIQKKIKKSDEYIAMGNPEASSPQANAATGATPEKKKGKMPF